MECGYAESSKTPRENLVCMWPVEGPSWPPSPPPGPRAEERRSWSWSWPFCFYPVFFLMCCVWRTSSASSEADFKTSKPVVAFQLVDLGMLVSRPPVSGRAETSHGVLGCWYTDAIPRRLQVQVFKRQAKVTRLENVRLKGRGSCGKQRHTRAAWPSCSCCLV
jgi:hypothetical protein